MTRPAALSALLAAAVAGVAALALLAAPGDGEPEEPAVLPGQPRVEVLTPRNGSRHENGSVVVRVRPVNFRLAPEHFGEQPRLGEGHIRFSLNRVPDCVDVAEIEEELEDPLGSGRIVGPSFDYPEYSGANGMLAELSGSAGSYSPATEPDILYANLNPGHYRLVVTLARNNGTTTPAHTAVKFQILPLSGDEEWDPDCKPGQVATQDLEEEDLGVQ